MEAKKFLKRHMTEIVQSIRNPMELADTLLAKKYVNDEMYEKIRAKDTKQEKTREMYGFLKTAKQCEWTYDWLKKNESYIFKELEESDRKTEAPQNLKMICTFAKLEKWVSTPEIGEKLISDLKEKLGNDGMEDLENGLKDKEPKNVLCFNAHNIDEIRKNKELARFLSTTEATTIPKLTYSMFFKKGGSGSSGNKNQSFSDFEECADMNADESNSGPESLLSSTFNDGDMDNMTSVNKDKKSESKTTEQVKANAPSQEPMDIQDTYINKEQRQRLNIAAHKEMAMHQSGQTTSKVTPLENGFVSMEMQDTHIDQANEELQESNVPNSQKHEVYLCQNDKITKKEIPLGDKPGSTVLQGKHVDETDDEPKRLGVPRDEDVLQITSTKASLEDGMESRDVQVADTDETNEKLQGLHFLNAQRDEDVFMNKYKIYTNIMEAPLEDESERMDVQDADIGDMNDEPQRSNVPDVLPQRNIHLQHNKSTTKLETPEDDCRITVMQYKHIDETNDGPKNSIVPRNEEVLLNQNEQITRKEAPLEDELVSMDVQDVDIDDISQKPQILCLTNDDVLLYQNEQITNEEAQLEDEHASTDMQNSDIEKMNDEPQRSNVPIVLTKGSVHLRQNELIIKIGTPAENIPERTDIKEIEEMNVQSQRPNVAVHEGVNMHQNESPTKNKTPLEDKLGSTVRQNTHVNKADEPKISTVPVNEDEFKSMVVQDANIDGIRQNPKRVCLTNVPRHEDVFLDKNETFSQKQPPLENTLGRKNMDEIDEEPQRSSVANIPIYGDTFLPQNDQLTNNITPVVIESGSTDKKEMHIDKINEDRFRSNVPKYTACLPQTESIINSKMPLQDRCENVNVQPSEPAVMLLNPEPREQPENSPGSALENTQRIGAEIWEKYGETALKARNDDMRRQKKREKSKQQRQKKKKEKDKLLCDWAESQCKGTEEVRNIFDNISIINMAEHNEYPCFTAENVMVYKYLTPESQILFVTDDNTSINTMTIVQYQMFVCDIKKAIILGPKKPEKQEIQYNKSKVPIMSCKNFIFQAFAPALVVYKKIQKEKCLYSLI